MDIIPHRSRPGMSNCCPCLLTHTLFLISVWFGYQCQSERHQSTSKSEQTWVIQNLTPTCRGNLCTYSRWSLCVLMNTGSSGPNGSNFPCTWKVGTIWPMDLVFMSTFNDQSMSVGCVGKLGLLSGLLRHYLLNLLSSIDIIILRNFREILFNLISVKCHSMRHTRSSTSHLLQM